MPKKHENFQNNFHELISLLLQTNIKQTFLSFIKLMREHESSLAVN